MDLTDALDELEHAMDKENQLTHELNTARRRDKTLSTKLKRLERVCQQQEEDIIRLSVELENIKMEMAAKDSGIVSPSGTRTRSHGRTSYPNNNGRSSPTSDFNDRSSDRLSAGYPERYWDRYSDRGSDSGSYVTTPHERKTFFDERFPDDMSTSDESEMRNRARQSTTSDVERLKRREKLLSRRLKNYQDVENKDGDMGEDEEDAGGQPRDRVGNANGTRKPSNEERAVDVAPDLLNTTPGSQGTSGTHSTPGTPSTLEGSETLGTKTSRGFLRTRFFAKKAKGNKGKSKSMDGLDDIVHVDVKNIHKKNKKYNFWGCVRARESINENIRSEYAPVKRPQLTPAKNDTNVANETGKTEGTAVDFI